MTTDREFDTVLRSWFDASAVSPHSAQVLAAVLSQTARTRPRPAWLARLVSEPMAGDGRAGIHRMVPVVLAATALVVAVLVGIGIVIGLPNVGPPSVPTQTPGPASAWTAAPDMPTGHYGHTLTLLPDGTVLVAGGISDDSENHGLTSAELYDPRTRAWSVTGDMLTPRYFATATLLPDGAVLMAGGENGGETLTTAELYEPSTGTWTPAGNMAKARSEATASLLADGTVLVAGGYADNGDALEIEASAELYDPSTGKWSPAGKMQTTRWLATATLLTDGTVLVAGGRDGEPKDGEVHSVASAELYEPGTRTWTTTGNLLAPSSAHTATLLPDGTVLVAGPSDGPAELYDPDTGSWTVAAGAIPQGGQVGDMATLLHDGSVLLVGLGQEAGIYNPVSGSWTRKRNPGKPVGTGALAVLLSDGTVLVAGGEWPGIETSAWLYHPGSPP